MYRFLRAAYRPSGCGRQQEKRKAQYSLAHLRRYQCLRIRLLRQQGCAHPQCRQSGCPRHTIHERMVGGPAKFGRTLIAHYGLLLLDLRNGCPSGFIRHPGKHLLPAMAARSRILLHQQQQDTLQLHHGQQKLLGRMYERSLLQQPEAW